MVMHGISLKVLQKVFLLNSVLSTGSGFDVSFLQKKAGESGTEGCMIMTDFWNK